MADLTFADVLDDSILVFSEDRELFEEWIVQQTGGGSDERKVDLVKQQMTFVPKLHKREEVVARVHLIGSVAAHPRSALWAWANPEYADSPVVTMATRIRDFGAGRSIAELTTGAIPLPEEGGDKALDAWAVWMAAASCRISGIPVAQVVSTGSTQVVLLVDAAGFTPARPSASRFPQLLASALEKGWLNDHRRAVQGYAQARNLPYGWEPGFAGINIGFAEGNLTVWFDEQGRVRSVNPPQEPGQPVG